MERLSRQMGEIRLSQTEEGNDGFSAVAAIAVKHAGVSLINDEKDRVKLFKMT
jgi:hypothetical protein